MSLPDVSFETTCFTQPHSQVGNDSTVDMGRIMQVLPGGTVEILSAEARLAAAMKGPTEQYMPLG